MKRSFQNSASLVLAKHNYQSSSVAFPKWSIVAQPFSSTVLSKSTNTLQNKTSHHHYYNASLIIQNASSDIRQERLVKPNTVKLYHRHEWHRFSSSSSLNNLDLSSAWYDKNNTLQDASIGSLTPSMWEECRQVIQWWLEQDSISSAYKAIRLLDRLVEEEKALQEKTKSKKGDGEISIPNFYNSDFLNLVINHWRNTFSDLRNKNSQIKYSKESKLQKKLSPKEMAFKMKQYHKVSHYLRPNTQTMSMIIDTTTYMRANQQGVKLAEKLLDWMISESSNNHHHHLRPNVYTFSSVMNTLGKSGKDVAPQKVSQIFNRMVQYSKNGHPEASPNQFSYSVAMEPWAKASRPDKVKLLLDQMLEEYASTNNQNLRPNTTIFNGYLYALAQRGEAEKAVDTLTKMYEMYDSGILEEPPDVISFTNVLKAFVNARRNGFAEKAESVLRQMKHQKVQPNDYSYHTVIHAYAQEGKVEQAERLLTELYTLYDSGIKEAKPSTRTYTLVLMAWSRSRLHNAGERGEAILDMLKNMAKNGEPEYAPDVYMYNAVLGCWAKSTSPNAVNRALTILETMKQDGVAPDSYSYNITLQTFQQSGGDPKRAEELVAEMIRNGTPPPDITTYNTLLGIWAKSGSSKMGDRALQILRQMQQKQHQDDNDNNKNEIMGSNKVLPDLITANTVLRCFTTAGEPERAEAFLQELCQPDSVLKPDASCYNRTISAWANSCRLQAPQHAERLLMEMKTISGIDPDINCFNSVLRAWSKSESPRAAERVESLFWGMYELYKEGHDYAKPNAMSFFTAINTWKKSFSPDAAERAEALLHDVIDKKDDLDLTPTNPIFGAMLHAWSKHKSPMAGPKAQEYLNYLIQNSYDRDGPTVVHFNMTMKAWSNNVEANDAFGKVQELFNLMIKLSSSQEKIMNSLVPDVRTFGILFLALARTNFPDKVERAKQLEKLMKQYKVKPDDFIKNYMQACLDA